MEPLFFVDIIEYPRSLTGEDFAKMYSPLQIGRIYRSALVGTTRWVVSFMGSPGINRPGLRNLTAFYYASSWL